MSNAFILNIALAHWISLVSDTDARITTSSSASCCLFNDTYNVSVDVLYSYITNLENQTQHNKTAHTEELPDIRVLGGSSSFLRYWYG